jgi:hypothetical protein
MLGIGVEAKGFCISAKRFTCPTAIRLIEPMARKVLALDTAVLAALILLDKPVP